MNGPVFSPIARRRQSTPPAAPRRCAPAGPHDGRGGRRRDLRRRRRRPEGSGLAEPPSRTEQGREGRSPSGATLPSRASAGRCLVLLPGSAVPSTAEPRRAAPSPAGRSEWNRVAHHEEPPWHRPPPRRFNPSMACFRSFACRLLEISIVDPISIHTCDNSDKSSNAGFEPPRTLLVTVHCGGGGGAGA